VLLEIDPTISKVEFKLGLDSRPFCSHRQVMIGLICIFEGKHYGLQQPNKVVPLTILNGKEEYSQLEQILKPFTEKIAHLLKNGISVDEV
jgi:hypothetical protein